tara:strand:- start:1063 stop:1377 length:315 start_codon:yes stop_codon:yes gene_type:complete
MIKKKIILVLSILFLLTSCGAGWDDIKSGITGSKRQTTEEFLVKKKDPLSLPPAYDSLPTPDDKILESKEVSVFEKTLEKTTLSEEENPGAKTTEESILRRIQK